jgi:transposase
MSSADTRTFEDVSQLQRQLLEQRSLIKKLTAQNAALASRTAQLEAEKRALFEQLRLAIEQRFGPSTEKYRIEQRDLFINEAEALLELEEAEEPQAAASADQTPTPAAPARRRGGRAPLPPELPRVEILHDLPEHEKRCAQDGTPLKLIGQEVSEQLDFIPAKLRVIRHVRLKYACGGCEENVQLAELAPQPLPKSNASPALLTQIAHAKYQDGLPLYRQERSFGRHGIELGRNTLARWMLQLGELIGPLTQELHRHLTASAVIHMDETTLQVNLEPGRTASSSSYMWVRRGGPPGQQVVLFDYDSSRAGAVPVRLLKGFTGTLLTDGYEGYAQAVRQYGLRHAGCWAHARRKFIEAQKLQPCGKRGRADEAIALIAKLYGLEKQARWLSAEERHALRQAHSRPLIEQIKLWLEQTLHQVPPKSALGKALHYLHGQWPKLTVFLTDGRIPLDNNPAENAIRPFVIGRKNWLFSHTPRGAEASATLYSLLETAKANGLNTYDYLLDVLTRLPAAKAEDDILALLPWHWGETLPI